MMEIWFWFIFANFMAFALMIVDKSAAEAGRRRIAESTLIGWSLIGGSFGALGASHIVRHKTRKQPIATLLRVIPFIHVGIAAIWILASSEALP